MKNFKRFSIGLISFTLIYLGEIAVNIACGPEPDPFDYYVSYFHNNVSGDEFVAFSFTDMTFMYYEAEFESEPDINAREWAVYLGNGVEPNEVHQIMYRSDQATDEIVVDYLSGDSVILPDSLAENKYVSALKKNKAAGDYFLFSKSLEPYAAVSYTYYWDPNPRDTMDMGRMEELGNEALKKTAVVAEDDFLHLRYAYQAARMFHYSGAYQACVDTYRKYFASNRAATAVSGWALSLYAGATRRLGYPAEAAYLFSKVFQSSPERRVQAYKNYHYIDVDFQEVLAHSQSDGDRAWLWAMQGFNHPDFDLETLYRVYELDPENQLVGTIITREINKLEAQLVKASNYYGGGWWSHSYHNESAQQLAQEHARRVIGFLDTLVAENRYPEPALGHIGKAYLEWLLGDVESAEMTLSQVGIPGLPNRLADQYRVTELLIQVHQLRVSDRQDEQALLPALQWLDQKCAQEWAMWNAANRDYYDDEMRAKMRFNRTATNLYQSVLAPHFMSRKDTAMAALLMWKGEALGAQAESDQTAIDLGPSALGFWREQLTPGALQVLAQWGEEGIPRSWTSLFQGSETLLTSDAFNDLLGTAYLRVHDYASAIQAFEKCSESFSPETPQDWYTSEPEPLFADPFTAPIRDYPKHFGSVPFSKLDFARKMYELEKNIDADPEHAAEYYFQLASGVYQTGAFGNAWQFISYTWSSNDNWLAGRFYYSGDFHRADQAAVWYERARALSDDREFQAKCTFMLAKCHQQLYRFDTISSAYPFSFTPASQQVDSFRSFSQQNPYFFELQSAYKDTEFFDTASAECTYLADFIATNPSP